MWFDFLLDDYIVPRLNNVSEEDVKKYRDSRDTVLSCLRPLQPNNLRMTHTGVGSLFASRTDYENSLERNISKLEKSPQMVYPN
ncbi:hypothetical protein IPL68_02240 [Candidatus Saccharibacteria bacterium]|nr:MAG: hypothetical protein IPL68_02240 [Candidatus Saccharibacteria bacterium]